MNDLRHSGSISSAEPSMDAKRAPTSDTKRRLTFEFLLTGIVATILIVSTLSAGGYYFVRSWSLQSTASRVAAEMHDKVMARVKTDRVIIEPQVRNALGNALVKVTGVNNIGIYDFNRKLLWSSSESMTLSQRESDQFVYVTQGQKPIVIFDRDFLKFREWPQLFTTRDSNLPALVSLFNADGEQVGVVKVVIDSQRDISEARNFGIGFFAAVLLATLLMFYLLYKNFKKGVQTIERQEGEMNHQIARLSNLLIINKSMQSSIKTASARAVELNEQFLRRTGADLHDGPAQMIGFAAMRLNKLSKEEAVVSLGSEFHTIREALDQSLDEIRGISSGLVLPELESMSFEQCLRKVVALHGTKSDAEVTQFHAKVPDEIALPIKICAYRFVQEGLNNAERHGKAEKCRLSTSFRDEVLEVSLKDNGMGFRKSQLNADGGHLGLVGMKDRIESIGGKFSINSELGVGTTLRFSVDLTEDT